MAERGTRAFRAGWMTLLGIHALSGAFGLALLFASTDGYARADAVAIVGMGLFGAALAGSGLRRGDRTAWFALLFTPLFWLAHWAWDLPPGEDRVHQVVFLAASLVALAATWRGRR